jgi:succinoglycan biosynthesis transport protein ExoP
MNLQMNQPSVAPSAVSASPWIVPGRVANPIASLRAHWGLAGCVIGLTLIVGVLIAQRFGGPQFHSEAAIRVSPRGPSAQQGSAWSTDSYVPDYRNFLQQQVFEISNYDVTSAALKLLGPKRSFWQLPGETDQMAAQRLLWKLKVQTVPDTYLITVGLDSNRPKGLADIVNAVVSAYLSREETQELNGTGQGVELLSKQKAEFQKQIDAERNHLGQLAIELGVSGFEAGMVNPFAKSLADANEALERSRRVLISAQAHLAGLQGQQLQVNDLQVDSAAAEMVINNPDVSAARSAIIHQREADFLILSGLGSNHPGRPALELEIKNIDEELARIDDTARSHIRSVLAEKMDANARQAKLEAQAQVDQAQRVQDETAKEVETLGAKVASASAKYSQAMALRETLDDHTKQVKDIDNEISVMRLQTQSPGFAALESPAGRADIPEKSRRKPILLLFAFASLALGLIVPTGVDLLDRRIKTSEELHATLGFMPLGVAFSGSQCPPQDALKRIALGIMRERRASGAKSFVLTPVGPRAGTTSLAFALAQTLAELGARTVVIEANATSPDPRYQIARAENTPSIKEVSAVDPFVSLPAARRDDQGHSIIEAGDSLPARIAICRHHGEAALTLRCVQKMIDLGLSNHDLVLLDTPPLLASADPAMIIQMFAAAILVVRSDRDEVGAIKAAGRELEKLGASAVGAIMTRDIEESDVEKLSNETRGLYQTISPATSLAEKAPHSIAASA